MPLSGPERVLRGKLAAHSKWAKTIDRTQATTALRAGFDARFVRQVDPDLKLDPAVRAKLVESARRAYFLQLAFRRVKAAKKKTAAAARPAAVKGGADGSSGSRTTD